MHLFAYDRLHFRMESTSILKVLSNFESAYLSRSLARILDPINVAFPDRITGPIRMSPKKEDMDRIIRVIATELELSRFDPHLVKMVTKNVQKAINMLLIKMEHLVC